MAISMLLGTLLVSMTANAWVGEFYKCGGVTSQFEFLIADQLTAADGAFLVPNQYVGTYKNNLAKDEGNTWYVTSGKNEIQVYNTDTGASIGVLKKQGVVSFSRILPSGAKNITLCKATQD